MSPSTRAGTKVSDDVLAHPWLCGVASERTRVALLRAGVERNYGADEVLYLAGSPATCIQLVLSGRVRLMRGNGQRAVMIHDEQAGGSLGEVPLFEGTTYPATAIASEPTRCLVLERQVVLAALRAEPDLALAILSRLAGRVRALVERIDQGANQSTLARLATLLLTRAGQARGARITLGGTHQQAAEEIGTVRELVVRGLRSLRDHGLIQTVGGGRYVILDETGLRRIARGGTWT